MIYRGFYKEAGQVVPETEAYQYALNRCLNGRAEEKKEFQEMLVEWYFSSGEWMPEEEEEEEEEWMR